MNMSSHESGPKPTPRRTPSRDDAKEMPRPTADSVAAEEAALASQPTVEAAEARQGTSRWAEHTKGHVAGSHPHNRVKTGDAKSTGANPTDIVRNVFVGVAAASLTFGAGYFYRMLGEGNSGSSSDPTTVTKERVIDGWKALCSGTKIVAVVNGSTYTSITAEVTEITPQDGQPILPSEVAKQMNAERNGDLNDDGSIDTIYLEQAKEVYTKCTTDFDQPPTTTTG